MDTWVYYLFPLFVLSGALSYCNIRWPQPALAVFNRWLRWGLFSVTTGLLLAQYTEIGKSAWVLGLCAAAVWFMGETLYNWYFIGVVSRSDIPLFPRYESNPKAEEWPNQRRFIRLREQLRQLGFRHREALRVSIGPGLYLRSSVFESEDGLIWVQVHLIPQRLGNFMLCFILHSRTDQDQLVVTDNVSVPSGCFFPESWQVTRRPLLRSLKGLLKQHRKRLTKAPGTPLPFDASEAPSDEFNRQQRVLERLNYDAGFLLPIHMHEEFGRLTQDGRYRLWKELWLIHYLGLSLKR
ncbi:MAG: hypothetical protein ACFBZ8_07945 [Opitutales bacterium]